jgi:hypothetical protein
MQKNAIDMSCLSEGSFTEVESPSSYINSSAVIDPIASIRPLTGGTLNGMQWNTIEFTETNPFAHGFHRDQRSSSEENSELTHRQSKRRAQNREA